MDQSYSDAYIGWQLITFIAVFTPVQLIITALRFYVRRSRSAGYDIGDYLVFVALLCQITASGIDLGATIQAGAGYHLHYLERTHPEKITLFFKYLVAVSFWHFGTMTIAKLAICKLYLDLFPQRIIRAAVWITIVVLILTPLVCVIVLFAACKPFSANWAPLEIQNTHCLNKEAIFVWGTLPNIVTDVVLLAIPLPVIWTLQMTTKIKIGFSITFAIGSLGLITSILRFIAFNNTNSFVDATWSAVELIIYTRVEPGIYLISACLITLRPLLDKVNTLFFRKVTSRVAVPPSTITIGARRQRLPGQHTWGSLGDDPERKNTLVRKGTQDSKPTNCEEWWG
ncbi:hypothetical protein GGR57DRAFT_487590 [Xylariaceae sp. FL1272]|nr:hypothetical protein GGR57DRAFT_487590 [Xylariaceae sp. FL1272]